MPTYEYACMDCGTHVEVFQHFSDDPLTSCGTCGGRLRKVFHPAGILFKGSGFYKTDSRSSKGSGGDSKSGDGAKTASKPSKPATSSGSGSSESGSSSSGSGSGSSGGSKDSGSSAAAG